MEEETTSIYKYKYLKLCYLMHRIYQNEHVKQVLTTFVSTLNRYWKSTVGSDRIIHIAIWS